MDVQLDISTSQADGCSRVPERLTTPNLCPSIAGFVPWPRTKAEWDEALSPILNEPQAPKVTALIRLIRQEG